MDYNHLLIEHVEDILMLTINREKALNALNKKTMYELDHFFRNYLPTIENYKGIIITGSGEKAFVAGADIKELIAMSQEEGKALSTLGNELFHFIETFHKPVIAAVNGFCLGGGCELAMACHMRIASTNARFGQPEVNLGIIPGYGGTQRLIQLIGKGKAIELLMTGDIIKSDQALSLGLVNHVFELGEIIDKSKAIINKIASKGPLSVAMIADCVDAYFDKNRNGFEEEIKGFGSMFQTDEFMEGASAFIEKRPANFKK
jgi:enoyl-CoA hydratase